MRVVSARGQSQAEELSRPGQDLEGQEGERGLEVEEGKGGGSEAGRVG